jgi:Ca2+:H+ antiporter
MHRGTFPLAAAGTAALRFSLGRWRGVLVILIPLAVALKLSGGHPVLTFASAALALAPLASMLGDATEQLAAHIGSAAGGLLNATLGNLTELIFGIVALAGGHVEVVKASLTGSILGNLLLVFGVAAFVGSLGREKLKFNRAAVGANTTMLSIATIALGMPSVFQWLRLPRHAPGEVSGGQLSLAVAAVLLVIYTASLFFMLHTHRSLFRGRIATTPVIGCTTALVILAATAGLIVFVSQILVGEIEFVARSMHWTELFIGLVIVGVLGNAAEHSSAVMLACRDQMDLSLQIAVGSGAQIALFIAPLLVVMSRAWRPESLVFHPLEIGAILVSVGVVTVASIDGETNWFEGLQLIGAYVILAAFFYFLPPLAG